MELERAVQTGTCLKTRSLRDLHPRFNAEAIAEREGCSVRKVNMTISLAFLAPDLVKAAIAGRLPLQWELLASPICPAEWARQHQMLGLPSL